MTCRRSWRQRLLWDVAPGSCSGTGCSEMTERDYSGRLIVLEGSDGAGKTTQLHLLVDRLIAAGASVVVTREPGGCIAAEAIRRVLLSDIDISPDAEVLLHTAARIEHVRKLIRPALVRGDFVVCDRFIDSTYAYQWAGFGADKALVDQMAALVGIDPDLVIVPDVSTEIGSDCGMKAGARKIAIHFLRGVYTCTRVRGDRRVHVELSTSRQIW